MTEPHVPAASTHESRRRIGFFGGSFNPIHNGHIALAKGLLKAAGLDEVWFVVSPQNPFKRQSYLLDDDARMEMVRAALADERQLRPCDIELTMPRPSYTWLTLQRLAHEHPEMSFTLLIGGDNWPRFGEWYHSADILKSYPIVIYPRRDNSADYAIDKAQLPAGVTLADTPLLDISSTEIRRLVAENKPIDGLVPPVVASIIKERGWYATPPTV